jgi:branched-chain amino acid aminotransferase
VAVDEKPVGRPLTGEQWDAITVDGRELLVYIDGELIPESTASVSAFDSGLNFGDGVFEGLRVYESKVFRLDPHVQRLYASAKAISLDIPMTPREMADEILRWLRANEIRDNFHFRPIVTRGPRRPPRLSPAFAGPATVVFVGGEIGAPSLGQRAIFASSRRPGPDVLDPKIKSLNFLSNIAARVEAMRAGVDDALVLDGAGFLAEASSANVFVVKDGSALTPYPKACLAGITRGEVMRLASDAGLDVREQDLSRTDVLNADELFICGTGAHLTPIVELDGLPIGEGIRGPITAHLTGLYDKVVVEHGDEI